MAGLLLRLKLCTGFLWQLKINKLRSSLLDLNGSFSFLNALRCLKPGQKHTLVLAFRPSQEKQVSKSTFHINNTSKNGVNVFGFCILVLWKAGRVRSNNDLSGGAAGGGRGSCCRLFSSRWDPRLWLCSGEGEHIAGPEGQATSLTTTFTSSWSAWLLMCAA